MSAVHRGELPPYSYNSPRAGLTRWPDGDGETGLNFSAELPDPLYASNERDRAPGEFSTSVKPTVAAAPAAPRRTTAIDAARHVVLRRLAPALKHDMVVNLQAVSMMAEMLNARLEKSGPQPADLQASIAKLNRLAREAVAKCLSVASWIEAGEDDTVTLHHGVQECVALMAGGLNFRGFQLVNDVPATEFEVCRGTLRTLLAGSLVSLADTVPGPGELQLRAQVSSQEAVLTLAWVPEDGDPPKPPLDPNAPRVEWADLQGLAEAERAELTRHGQQVTIRLPRAVPSSPLRMAPM